MSGSDDNNSMDWSLAQKYVIRWWPVGVSVGNGTKNIGFIENARRLLAIPNEQINIYELHSSITRAYNMRSLLSLLFH